MGGQPSERDRQFDWDGQTVGDPMRAGRQQIGGSASCDEGADARWTSISDHQSSGTGEVLGNTEYAGRQRLSPTARKWSNGTKPWAESEGPCEPLGESSGSGLSRPTCERQEWLSASAGYWPPDRSYRGEWSSELEPAVRRVADGMAPWVDRLRLTGNGVVPLAAAVAFLRLRTRLMLGHDKDG
jgi:hypothetical protein